MAFGLDINTLFDNNFYLFENPDVANAVKSGAIGSGLDHFLAFGQFEGRDPNPFFDTNFYLDANPDVKASVEKDPLDDITGISHFLSFGQYEGRDPSAEFDTSYYLNIYPEVKDAVERDQLTGIEHFIKLGRFQGLESFPRLVETELYFGKSISGGGMVSEEQFQQFLNNTITPRFRDGLTVYDANRQFLDSQGRVSQEASKVVLLIYSNTPENEQLLKEVVEGYKQQFKQQSVVRVSTLPATIEF